MGSINLTQFVKEEDNKVILDIDGVTKYVKYLVRFLDNVNEYSDAPLSEYVDSMRNKRRIGCGVMGWGSTLFMLGVRFGSEEAAQLREKLMKEYAKAAYEASIDLAVERGMFKYCDPGKHSQGVFVNSIGLSEEYMTKLRDTGIRNSSLLSQQPTGNTSILANIVSGGIEPIFMPEYIRTVTVPVVPAFLVPHVPKFWQGEFSETDIFKLVKEGDEPILKATVEGVVYKIDKGRGLVQEVPCKDYAVRWLEERGKWDKEAYWAATTTELSVEDHVSDLKGFAKYTDSACSKTVNIPNDYSYEKFKGVYLDVYNTGYIKGFTTYRAGTMTTVLSANEEKPVNEEEIILDDVKLADSLPAVMKRLKAEGKKWYLTVIMNEDNSRPVAFFTNTNHPEKTAKTEEALTALFAFARAKKIPERFISEIEQKIQNDNNTSKLSRAISLLLRHGVLVKNVVACLETVDITAGSFLFAVKKYLSSFIKDGEEVQGEKCEVCGGKIIYQEGCKKCVNCGNSKCG